MVADALSRIETNALLTKRPPVVDFVAMAEAQFAINNLKHYSPHRFRHW